MVNKGRRSEVSIVDSRHNQQNSNYRDTVNVCAETGWALGAFPATIPWVLSTAEEKLTLKYVSGNWKKEPLWLYATWLCSCEFVVCKDASQLAAGTSSTNERVTVAARKAAREATSDGHSIISPSGSLSESWEWKVSGCIWSGNPTQQKDMEGPFSLTS